MAETRFIQLKRKWRRLRFDQGQELDARHNMLEAKRLVVKYRRKEQRKHQRGCWHLISVLREGGKGEAMWRKLKQKKINNEGKGSLDMLEAGVRAVAQIGFPHEEESSAKWAEEMSRFTHSPTSISDGIIDSKDLWALKRGKAAGEDGWCEELLLLFKMLGGNVFTDLQNALKLLAMYAKLPRYQRGSLIKPILKPGKIGESHNEYRKLSIMSVLRKRLEKIGSLMMRPYWTAGAYQAGFRKGKRASSRIFILLAVVAKAFWPTHEDTQPEQECGVLLVDFEKFFDTLRPERLFHKMQQVGLPPSVIGLWKELFETHTVKVCFAGTVGKPIRVLVGVPQGSGWSPELATLYVDVGLADGLCEVHAGVVEIQGVKVHLLMYADDLLTANLTEEGIQQQFSQIEKISEIDGLRISYKKTVFAVFRKACGASRKWTIKGKRGEIEESPDAAVKYLGFFAEADGYTAHWEYLAKRVAAAAGALIQMFSEHPYMTFSMRREVYVAKVRTIMLVGAEIWGWRKAVPVQKAEAKALCILLKVHTNTKLEAMLWLCGMLPLWVEAAKLAFGFWISVLDHGDELEIAALNQWKDMSRKHRRGWFHDMLILFQEINLLEEVGGREAVYGWNVESARMWKQNFVERCEQTAIQQMDSSLQNGKYSFLRTMIPQFGSPRPFSMCFGDRAGKSLFQWLLCSHSLEVETGRYDRKPRHERICQRCWKLLYIEVLGDETHALTQCARGEVAREEFAKYTGDLVGDAAKVSIFEAVPRLQILPRSLQCAFWKGMSKITHIVTTEIRSERLRTQQVPNQWNALFQAAQVRSLVRAAETTFRRRLRKRIQRSIVMISSDESDEVIFVSQTPSRR